MHFGSSTSRWGVRLLTFSVWALVAGSAVFWALQRPPRMASGSGADGAGPMPAAIDTQRVAQALGATKPDAPAAASTPAVGNLRLLGVITQGAGGAALVSVDDGPARPVRLGQAPAELEGGWSLQAVAPHSAVFAAGDERLELQMPPMDARSRAGDAVAPESRPVDAESAAAGRDGAQRRAPDGLSRVSRRAANPDR